ncbi:hypothetical protein [Laspinema olomoucense]|uniref:Uncharacterized protein n=1 Tax=Laspinema olomoucense D3b TaxID=2953688 RepID=A0ABT2N5A5_9CYAN|nr:MULTISPECIES: hypothetical protein [unclassified Laspinema]MCT7973139.1 hypothetical protein [Laspinema sp. D3d]MCT7977838.1 hypothetical protein [Laspinema sp. D3b]MCT7994145.1 hypothetical protein [Laspinema sp. D3c]
MKGRLIGGFIWKPVKVGGLLDLWRLRRRDRPDDFGIQEAVGIAGTETIARL